QRWVGVRVEVAGDVPQRCQVRSAVRAEGGQGDHGALGDIAHELLRAHPGLVTSGHVVTYSRAISVAARPERPVMAASRAPRRAMSSRAALSARGTRSRDTASTNGGRNARISFIAPTQRGMWIVRARRLMPSCSWSSATSSGYVLPRGPGTELRSLPNTGWASALSTRSVLFHVGWATPTLTPRCATSARRLLQNASTPALAEA